MAQKMTVEVVVSLFLKFVKANWQHLNLMIHVERKMTVAAVSLSLKLEEVE